MDSRVSHDALESLRLINENMKIKNIICSCLLLSGALTAESAMAQYPIKIHSHNDYVRTVPFYQAYAQRLYSIEVDMFYQDGEFFVGHNIEDIDENRTFEALYLKPLIAIYNANDGKPWADSDAPLQLMIEMKSNNRDEAMKALIKIFEENKELFNPEVNPNALHITITGSYMPTPEMFEEYPSYIKFDGDLDFDYTPNQLDRVALFSTNFAAFSGWNGKGYIVKDEMSKIKSAIAKAHSLDKPIRFWGAPDGITAWNTFYNLGIDYVNTDKVEKCADFFTKFYNKNYVITSDKSAESHTSSTDRLDKTTKSFAGFNNEKLQLTEPIKTYTPTYESDGADRPIKNVIFLIGDGMGLSQVTAAERVNKSLSILSMRNIGLITTSASDAFTTDSAAAGSALSTGEVVPNRSISVSDNGEDLPLITDYFIETGRACGVVTMGNVADATPAVFYAHNTERDNAKEISRSLLENKLSLLAGSGIGLFKGSLKGELEQHGYKFSTNTDEISSNSGRMICIDESMGKAAEASTISDLATITKRSIENLSAASDKGFFLMVEAAKIDYSGHANCFPASIVETLALDLAVAEALKFADENGDTLVIVTGDHETGGLTLIDGDNTTGQVTAYYVTDDHTPIMLPVYSYGPQADKFIGKYFNYDIPRKLKQYVK